MPWTIYSRQRIKGFSRFVSFYAHVIYCGLKERDDLRAAPNGQNHNVLGDESRCERRTSRWFFQAKMAAVPFLNIFQDVLRPLVLGDVNRHVEPSVTFVNTDRCFAVKKTSEPDIKRVGHLVIICCMCVSMMPSMMPILSGRLGF